MTFENDKIEKKLKTKIKWCNEQGSFTVNFFFVYFFLEIFVFF